MLGQLQDLAKSWHMMQRLMQNESFKALSSHPKIQQLLRDPEFQAALHSRDLGTLATLPKFTALLRDPELAALIGRLSPQPLIQDVPGSC